MATTEQPTIRLDAEVGPAVQEMAHRVRRPVERVANELLDQSLRARQFPGIVFVEGPAGVRAHLAGTGLDVWEAIALVRQYGSPAAVAAALPSLVGPQLQIALAYASAYSAEVEQAISENSRTMHEVMREFPFVQVVEV
jgi:uncharacterized protein (DUF433 family)